VHWEGDCTSDRWNCRGGGGGFDGSDEERNGDDNNNDKDNETQWNRKVI
jgi:hypothetical protein